MATTWTATSRGSRSGQASQATTETAPSGNTGLGVDLDQVESVAVVFRAPSGETFDGTGKMDGYRLILGGWARAPRADVEMADYASLSNVAIPSMRVDCPVGRFLYVPNGVGLSGGTTITTDYVCTLRNGSQG